MLSAAQWGQINTILVSIKQTKKMWGGMIVVFAGDYSQLPPVMAKKVYINYPNLKDEEINGIRCFNSIEKVIVLDQGMRFTDNKY